MEMDTEVISAEMVKYINERAKNLVRYSDKLSDALNSIDDYFEIIGPKVGIRFTDKESFFEERHEYLGKVFYHLSVRKDWGLYVVSSAMEIEDKCITDCSRFIKKEAIKRLPEFLKLYSLEAERFEKEYKDISEKAEKMAAILRRN